jgi:hypothetical protein
VVLFNIVENDGVINLTYWDYGCNTLRQLPTKVFNDILFGITWCNKKGVE